MKNIFIPIFLILNIISISIYGRSQDILEHSGSDHLLPDIGNAGVDNQSFSLDELWQLSAASPTISQQINDLSWDYDEFRSNVRLGNHSGTQIGSQYITLDGHTDLRHGMLAFTYQLNNALNAEKTAVLTEKAAKGNISEEEFITGFGGIESTGVIDQILVAAEMNISTEAPFGLKNMVQGYQSGEFNLVYLQNWTYINCIKDKRYIEHKAANLPSVFLQVKPGAQNNTDRFLQTLHNRDVKLTIEFVAPEKSFDDSGKFQPSAAERILTSVNVDLVKNACSEHLLIEKLMKLLNDPEKDWYANLLLYNLTGKLPSIPSEKLLPIDTRAEWLQPMSDGALTYKAMDVKMWEKYFSGLTKSKKSQ